MHTLDLDARYTVDGYGGVAFYVLGYLETQGEDFEWTGIPEVDTGFVRAVMVGDDREHIVDVDDLILLADGDYCTECGQVGCKGDMLYETV